MKITFGLQIPSPNILFTRLYTLVFIKTVTERPTGTQGGSKKENMGAIDPTWVIEGLGQAYPVGYGIHAEISPSNPLQIISHDVVLVEMLGYTFCDCVVY